MPPSSFAQGGITLLLLPSCCRTSCIVWPFVYWMNWTPCGAFPWLASSTLTRPPFAVFGAWKAAVLPVSPMVSERVVGLLLLSLRPQPAIAAAAPIVAAKNATRLCICTSNSYLPPLPLIPDPHPNRASLAHLARRRQPRTLLGRLCRHRPDS